MSETSSENVRSERSAEAEQLSSPADGGATSAGPVGWRGLRDALLSNPPALIAVTVLIYLFDLLFGGWLLWVLPPLAVGGMITVWVLKRRGIFDDEE